MSSQHEFEPDIDSIAFLGDLAGVAIADEFMFMQIDTVILWIKNGCPDNFIGQSNGMCRFRIAQNLASRKLFDPVLVRDIRKLDTSTNAYWWHKQGDHGHPSRVLAGAVRDLEELREGAEASE